MRATVKNKKKGPANAVTRQQALIKSESPQPKRLKGELSSEGAELQRKMKAAAKEFMEIYRTEDTPIRISSIYCTPTRVVLFRLGDEWVKLTQENVEEACKEIAEDESLSPELYAKIAMRSAQQYAKAYGRVGWVLPRLEKEVA